MSQIMRKQKDIQKARMKVKNPGDIWRLEIAYGLEETMIVIFRGRACFGARMPMPAKGQGESEAEH